jgi:hypothetical protein
MTPDRREALLLARNVLAAAPASRPELTRAAAE